MARHGHDSRQRTADEATCQVSEEIIGYAVAATGKGKTWDRGLIVSEDGVKVFLGRCIS